MDYVNIQPVVPNNSLYCTSFYSKCWMCLEQNTLIGYLPNRETFSSCWFLPLTPTYLPTHVRTRSQAQTKSAGLACRHFEDEDGAESSRSSQDRVGWDRRNGGRIAHHFGSCPCAGEHPKGCQETSTLHISCIMWY